MTDLELAKWIIPEKLEEFKETYMVITKHLYWQEQRSLREHAEVIRALREKNAA